MNDKDLITQFEGLTLPFENWTHRTHVRVAYLYAIAMPYPEALDTIRKRIQAFNRKNKVMESPTSGYNETTTVAFMKLIVSTIQAYGDIKPTSDSESFCDTHPHLLSKTILRLFYSPERRGHPDAKTKFVEPDLCRLPEIDWSGFTS